MAQPSTSPRTRRTWFVGVLILASLAALVAWWFFKPAGDKAQAPGAQGAGRPQRVVTAPAEAVTLTRRIEGIANVEADQAVTVTAKRAGRVVALLFEDGQFVQRGAPLVRLESAEPTADVAALRAEAAELQGRLERLDRLAAEGAVARGRADDLRRQLQAARARIASAESVLQDTLVRAPFAGRVGLRQLSLGALLEPGTPLVTLDDTRNLKLRFAIGEQDIGRVRVGSPVEVSTSAYPGRSFEGRVTSFASRLDPAQRTLDVQARLANPQEQLRPGMLATMRVGAETVQNAVVVPAAAVQVRGDAQFVWRIVDGCAERADVVAGQREPQRIEIVKGLRAGDRVVVEGVQRLRGGAPVVEAGQGGQSQGGQAPPIADGEAPRCQPAAGQGAQGTAGPARQGS